MAGLGVIGLMAWACSGVAGGNPASRSSRGGRVSAVAYGSTAAGQPAGGQPGAGAGASSPASSAPADVPGSASPGSPSASSASGAALSSPYPAASRRSAPPAARGTGKNRAAQAAAGGGTCSAADIVLTLVASKPSYGPRAQPRFHIEIVSTGATACAFDIGPASLRVVVTHGGEIVWNSGACPRDAASRVTRLRRGVPVAVSVVWNRTLTVAGCPTTVKAASQRTYVAVAQSGTAQSPGQAVRLK